MSEEEKREYTRARKRRWASENPEKVAQHRKNSSQKKSIYECKECSYTSNNTSNLLRHTRTQHMDKNLLDYFNCTECDYKALTKADIKRHHRRVHEENTYVFRCDQCDHMSKTQSDMNRHIYDVHEKNKIFFKCDKCDYQTPRQGTLSSHLQKKHNLGTIRQRCTYDGCTWETASAQPSFLRQHVARFHEPSEISRSHECDECTYKTFTNSALAVHKSLKHNVNVQWFGCQLCPYKAKTKGMLQSHIRNKHEELSKEYACSLCSFISATKGNLKRHVDEYHERSVVYNCDMCDFETFYKSSIYTHQKSKHSDAVFARSKQQEQRIAMLLLENGWTEWFDSELMPSVGCFKREKRIDFACVDADDTWCRIDFVLARPKGYVFLEVDENQHKFGYDNTLSCDMKRMAKVMNSICVENFTSMPYIFWLRYNPNAWRIDNILQTVAKKEREHWLINFLNELDIETPLAIGYAYYDTMENGLIILENEEYHEQFADVALNLTQVVCQPCDD